MAEVEDKYGNNGWVGEFLYHVDGDTAVIDNFLMSCRVMGRMVEDAILAAVFEKLAAQGVKKAQAFYKKTAKNKPVEELWDKIGFACVGAEEEKKEYERMLNADKVDQGCRVIQDAEDADGSRGDTAMKETDIGSIAGQIHTVIWDE